MILIPILLIIGGVLAASSLIIQKQPNARELIGKLVPFQGIIGIALLVWGLIALLFWGLPVLTSAWVPFSAKLVTLLSILVTIALGFLLGYGLIAQHLLSKNADAARSGQAAHAKLVGYQVPLGIIGIVLGLWALISFMMSPVRLM